MRTLTRTVWPLLLVGGLLVIGIATVIVAFGDGSRRLGPAPLHADIVVTPFASIPIQGMTFPDLEDLLIPLIMERLADDGPLRYRVQPQVLRNAREVGPILLRDSNISNAYDDLPAIVALRAAAEYEGLARVTLRNRGETRLEEIAMRLPGVQTARVIRTRLVPDEDKNAARGATKTLVDATVVRGEKSVVRVGGLDAGDTLTIEGWLDRKPDLSDWRWADQVRLISSAGAGWPALLART